MQAGSSILDSLQESDGSSIGSSRREMQFSRCEITEYPICQVGGLT